MIAWYGAQVTYIHVYIIQYSIFKQIKKGAWQTLSYYTIAAGPIEQLWRFSSQTHASNHTKRHTHIGHSCSDKLGRLMYLLFFWNSFITQKCCRLLRHYFRNCVTKWPSHLEEPTRCFDWILKGHTFQ